MVLQYLRDRFQTVTPENSNHVDVTVKPGSSESIGGESEALTADVLKLENMLASGTLSDAKHYSVKKELAMVKAKLIRLSRSTAAK